MTQWPACYFRPQASLLLAPSTTRFTVTIMRLFINALERNDELLSQKRGWMFIRCYSGGGLLNGFGLSEFFKKICELSFFCD